MSSQAPAIDPAAFSAIVNEGFSEAASRKALLKFNNDVEASITWLIENPDGGIDAKCNMFGCSCLNFVSSEKDSVLCTCKHGWVCHSVGPEIEPVCTISFPSLTDSHPATNRGVDSKENILKFIYHAREATHYDNLLLDGSISNADVRGNRYSALHHIPMLGKNYKADTDMLICYLLTCDPPADVNGRTLGGHTPMWQAAYHNNTSAVKVLVDFGGDRTIRSNNRCMPCPNMTPLESVQEFLTSHPETIKLLSECFPSEE